MFRTSQLAPLFLFLVVCTLVMAAFSPAYAIFPVFVMFCVGVAVFFRPKPSRRPTPRAPLAPLDSQYRFEGDLSPYAYSRLALLDQTARKRRHKGPMRRDEEIAADVQARLLAEPGLAGSGIKATSRFGRVTLEGRVFAEADKERARRIAYEVAGVVDVSVQLHVAPRTA